MNEWINKCVYKMPNLSKRDLDPNVQHPNNQWGQNDTCAYVTVGMGKPKADQDGSHTTVPDKLATNKHVESQLDHVPRGWPVILHHVQCHGNMGVTVVTTKVMLKQGKQKVTSYNCTLLAAHNIVVKVLLLD